MVLSQWLERGLGQMMAPDPNYKEKPQVVDTQSSFWQFVAPDPQFAADDEAPTTPAASRVPPSTAFQVQCIHCHQYTPTAPRDDHMQASLFRTPQTQTPPAAAVAGSNQQAAFQTPASVSASSTTAVAPSTPVDVQVLAACHGWVETMHSPAVIRDKRARLFRLCSTKTALSPKLLKAIKKELTANPHLFAARASNMGVACPDGYTPLLAAVQANQHGLVAWMLKEGPPEQLVWTNLKGETALHVAAARGHLECVQILHQAMQENKSTATNALDLHGRTPLGMALTSPEPKASQHREALSKALLASNERDVSLFGSPLPARQRVWKLNDTVLVGTATLPGKRVLQEDAVRAGLVEDAASNSMACVAVCDGHGDHGAISKFVADRWVEQQQDAWQEWRDALKQEEDPGAALTRVARAWCDKVEVDLRLIGMPGGSTCCAALVTEQHFVLVNVGDSRGILISKSEAQVDQVVLEEGQSPFEHYKYVVEALTTDHKPNLPEEEARITKAGLTVKLFGTTPRIVLSENDSAACSRAFGDFEYKANNKHLSDEEQAVVATPEVCLRPRARETDAYLLLASDGVWDVMTNEEVGKFVVDHLHSLSADETAVTTTADALVEHCLVEKGTTDNCSVALVALQQGGSSDGPNKTLVF